MPGSPSASPAKDSDATPALCVHAQTAKPLQRTLWQRLCALVFASPETASHESLLASAQAHPITLSASQYTATPMASVTPRIAPQPRLLEQGEATARLRSHLPALDSPLLAPHARPEAPSPLQTPALFGRFPPSHPTSLGGDMVAATAASGSPAHKRRSGGTAPPLYDSPVSHFLVSRRHRHDSDDGAQMTQLLDALSRACSPAPAPPPATRSQLRLTAQRRRAGAGLPCAILAESESSSDGDSSNDDGHVPGMLHGYVPGEADNDKELLMVRTLWCSHMQQGPQCCIQLPQPSPVHSARSRILRQTAKSACTSVGVASGLGRVCIAASAKRLRQSTMARQRRSQDGSRAAAFVACTGARHDGQHQVRGLVCAIDHLSDLVCLLRLLCLAEGHLAR